jgi:hypothetical protein
MAEIDGEADLALAMTLHGYLIYVQPFRAKAHRAGLLTPP